MLESILNTAKGYIASEVGKNANVPKQQSSAVSDVIFNTVSSSLQSQLGGSKSGGFDISQLSSLLGGGGGNSAFVNSLSKSVVDALVKKAGLQSGIAQSIASAIIPGLISSLTKQSGGGNMLGSLAGGLLGKFGK
jgi:hypothetical protein